ncbi:hypothetical protein [Methylocystis heyeri]|uniref:Uncharacterized protein n=1 Tax=Methylocystis heyeri TaxID=391905 RepID=A0A6B8KIR8_9HYPH|nr:hypothetical protein [Methylocystis heyeri]QGM48264.1 hypothetical protein H2LOC_020985 [Methylocystis heyeri]
MGILSAIFGNKNAELNDHDFKVALRQSEIDVWGKRPSWIGNNRKEKEFFDGVMTFSSRLSVPAAYIMHGFMSPQSSDVMFGFAANMESKGASFTQQQMATATFIEGAWDDMSSDDKTTFLKATAR